MNFKNIMIKKSSIERKEISGCTGLGIGMRPDYKWA